MLLSDLYLLIIISLASSRLTRVVIEDSITNNIRAKIIKKFTKNHWLTVLVHCPWCSGWWITTAIVAVAHLGGLTSGTLPALLMIPAAAYGAALFGKIVEG